MANPQFSRPYFKGSVFDQKGPWFDLEWPRWRIQRSKVLKNENPSHKRQICMQENNYIFLKWSLELENCSKIVLNEENLVQMNIYFHTRQKLVSLVDRLYSHSVWCEADERDSLRSINERDNLLPLRRIFILFYRVSTASIRTKNMYA